MNLFSPGARSRMYVSVSLCLVSLFFLGFFFLRTSPFPGLPTILYRNDSTRLSFALFLAPSLCHKYQNTNNITAVINSVAPMEKPRADHLSVQLCLAGMALESLTVAAQNWFPVDILY